jgi:luciferase family oxidoreductase group 1
MAILLNILDYSSIDEGANARQALLETTELAKRADELGYFRFWVAEHHHVLSVAGSSPEMLMMHLATATSRMRIGSGGVMLPHYSPYKVAENFRMLEALHPNRIDLGIGRSPSYRIANRALNETKGKRLSYEQQVQDVYKFLTDDTSEDHRFNGLIATPIIETTPEIWMLGTGMSSAEIAADSGSSYAFAHFAKPSGAGLDAVNHYRKHFKPSLLMDKPKVMIAVFAIIAETAEKAEELAKAFDLWLLFVESDNPPPYYPSVETAKKRGISSVEKEKVMQNRKRMIIGDAEQVREEIERIADLYQAGEVAIIPNFFGADNREKGIALLAQAFGLH